MAKILADEHFPVRILDRLRRLGHDVTTVRNYDENKAGDGKSDEEVLRIAALEERAVLTMNKKDFKALHEARIVACHKGIIACDESEATPQAQAKWIHDAIKFQLRATHHLDQQLILITGKGEVRK